MKRGLMLLGLVLLVYLLWQGPAPMQTDVYLQGVSGDRATIALITPEDERLGVELREHQTDSGMFFFRRETKATRQHAMAIRGLKPATRYSYRIFRIGEEGDGEALHHGVFRSAPANTATTKTRIVAVGDSGGMPYWFELRALGSTRYRGLFSWAHEPRQWRIAEQMEKDKPDMFLHLGDIVYHPDFEHGFGEAFFLPFGELLKSTPLYTVIGNHDIPRGGKRAPYLDVFHLPDNPVTGDSRHYTFTWGNARFVVLDSMDATPEASVWKANTKALAWVDKTLAAATEQWRIVALHVPIWSASRHKDHPQMIEHLWPILVKHKVDLVLAGHDHVYMRMKPIDGIVHVVAGGGGKSLYKLYEHKKLDFALGDYSYLVLDIDGNSLTGTCKDIGGHRRDEFVLSSHR